MASVGEAVKAAIDSVKGMVGNAVEALADTPPEIRDGEEYYRSALEEQKAFHPVWYRNIAMYIGQQWLDWSSTTNWFQETSAPSWRVRCTTNLIMPKIRAIIAKELQTNPRFYAMPANGDVESKKSARVGSRVFEAKYYDEDFINRMARLRMWAKMTGSSFLMPLWDQSRGRKWSDIPPAQPGAAPETGPDGKPVPPKPQDFCEGDVNWDVANSFEILMEPGAPEDFNEHQRLMRVKLMNVKQIKANWKVDVEPEKITLDIVYQVRIMSMIDAGGRFKTNTAEGQILKNSAIVKDYYELPTEEFPNGRHFTYANGVVLTATEDLDYWYCGRRAIPAAKDDDIPVPGRAHGQSSIEHAAPLNVQYNKMMSSAIENGNLLGRPKVIAPPGSLADDTFTDQPGEIVEAVPGPNGEMPKPWTPPEMPEYFFRVKDELKTNVEDILQAHDVSLGRLPRRANSGVAIDALQAGDDGPVNLSVKSFASALSRAFSIALDQMQRKYTEQRLVRMIGKTNEVDVITFKGADLKGCDSVRVTFGPQLTKQQRTDLAMQMQAQGMISTQQALDVMELGDLNIVFDKDQGQKNYADFENFGLAKGIMYPVGLLEPHEIHIKGHLAYCDEHEKDMTPEGKQAFAVHIQQHQAAAAAQAPGAMPPGAPGVVPPGQGAPPPLPPPTGGSA